MEERVDFFSMLPRDILVCILDLLDRSFSVRCKTRVASQTCKTWRMEVKGIRASRIVLIGNVYRKLVCDIESRVITHHGLSMVKRSHRLDALIPTVDDDGNEILKNCFYVVMDYNEIFIHGSMEGVIRIMPTNPHEGEISIGRQRFVAGTDPIKWIGIGPKADYSGHPYDSLVKLWLKPPFEAMSE
jgi:hypothetical protein